MNIFKASIIAGIGGFFGTCLRFCSEKLGALICAGNLFPLGTFMANMLGCYLIGVFYAMLNKDGKYGKDFDLMWITGFCGNCTTFSSFSDQMVGMLERGDDATFWLYLFGSVILGLILVVLGIMSVRGTNKGQTVRVNK